MRRKFITWSVVVASIAIALYTSTVIYAALTKTSTETVVHAWNEVLPTTAEVGTAGDVSASYSTALCLETGCTEAGDFSGATFYVEISYDTENWMLLTSFTSSADATVGADDVNDASSTAGDATLTVTDAVSDELDVVGRTWLIWDGTAANSEICRTISKGTTVDVDFDTLTLADPTTHDHLDGVIVYDRAETFIVALPLATRQVRVICYNGDDTINCAYQYSVLKVTAIQ